MTLYFMYHIIHIWDIGMKIILQEKIVNHINITGNCVFIDFIDYTQK